MSHQDSWCRTIRSRSGHLVHGGAARNIRIAACGGMDRIVEEVASEAATSAFERASLAVKKSKDPVS